MVTRQRVKPSTAPHGMSTCRCGRIKAAAEASAIKAIATKAGRKASGK